MRSDESIPGPEQQSRAESDDAASAEASLFADGRSYESVLGPEQQSGAESNATADNESSLYAVGSLEEAARRSEHRRRERLLDVLSSGRIMLAWVLIGVAIVFIGIMGWHYFAPTQWGWLDEAQINRAESAIAGGAVSLLILFLRRYL